MRDAIILLSVLGATAVIGGCKPPPSRSEVKFITLGQQVNDGLSPALLGKIINPALTICTDGFDVGNPDSVAASNMIPQIIAKFIDPLRIFVAEPLKLVTRDKIHLVNTPPDSSGCDAFVTYQPTEGRSFCDGNAAGGPHITIFKDQPLFPMKGTLTHEFGHAFGLGDTYQNGTSGTCQPGQDKSLMCSTAFHGPQDDDINGLLSVFMELNGPGAVVLSKQREPGYNYGPDSGFGSSFDYDKADDANPSDTTTSILGYGAGVGTQGDGKSTSPSGGSAGAVGSTAIFSKGGSASKTESGRLSCVCTAAKSYDQAEICGVKDSSGRWVTPSYFYLIKGSVLTDQEAQGQNYATAEEYNKNFFYGQNSCGQTFCETNFPKTKDNLCGGKINGTDLNTTARDTNPPGPALALVAAPPKNLLPRNPIEVANTMGACRCGRDSLDSSWCGIFADGNHSEKPTNAIVELRRDRGCSYSSCKAQIDAGLNPNAGQKDRELRSKLEAAHCDLSKIYFGPPGFNPI